ncbi:hypothetical protein ACGLFO_10065 [Corynebacterium hesseae]|uniref:hypothetical protein n=1 Tax=Corynebacterium hesseae TaxID=2913502 RepID=UPI00373FB9FA
MLGLRAKAHDALHAGAVVPGAVEEDDFAATRETIKAGATLASHSVALPASVIGSVATVGPGSLVMRGDQVPSNSVWQGNPIEPWKK